MLKTSNDRNVTFNTENALSFEGDSASFIQYNCVRINSILKKVEDEIDDGIDYPNLLSKSEIELINELSKFSNAVEISSSDMSPHTIAKYVYKFTKKFSAFYHECPILNSESIEVKNSRLVLLKCVQQVLKNGMYILGIEAVDSM